MVHFKLKLFIFSFLLTTVILTYKFNGSGYNYLNYMDEMSMEVKKMNKTILYWNPFFGNYSYFGHGWEAFQHCEINSCYITSNRNYLPVDEFDAVLFHSAEYTFGKHKRPEKRDPKQRYIFYTWETATNRVTDSHFWYGFYNWTMTFWRKSDIYMPYGDVIQEDTNYVMPTVDFVRKKKKMAAWFVSNCRSKSKRQQYVEELKKYIDVDVYGRCGTKKCPRSSTEKCYEMMEDNYLFYLSFENTFCEDYVTEKLYYVLNYNVVPIGYGLANYTELAPPYSVINTAHFKSAKSLAKYLIYLRNHPEKYLKYFEWKKNYVVYNKFAAEAMCTLCKKMHYDTDVKTYENIRDWWKSGCIDHRNIHVLS